MSMQGCLHRTGLGLHHMLRVVVFVAYHHDLIDEHRHLEAVLVLYENDVLPLETSYASTADLTEESHLISDLHDI